jgi:membrane-associated phospholipid phosphatase
MRPHLSSARSLVGGTIVAGAVLVATTVLVVSDPLPALDVTTGRWFARHRQQWLVTAADTIRLVAAQAPLLLTPVFAFAWWRLRQRRAALALLCTVAATFLVSLALKLVVGRPGPSETTSLELVTTTSDWSFPSLSAAVTVAFWGLVAALSTDWRPTPRRAVRGLAVLAIGLIGVSRLYVGEHWLTDVVAGYAVGAAVLATTLRVAAGWHATPAGDPTSSAARHLP